MDCLEGMKMLPDESLDLVVTDPPYNVNKFETDHCSLDVFKEFPRILKKGGVAYVFYSSLKIPEIQNAIPLELYNILVWHVPNNVPTYDRNRWAFSWQPILFFVNGKPRIKIADRFCRRKETLEIQKFNNTAFQPKFHPTEKPLKLIHKLVFASSNKNDIIFDPFMGSGTTAVACKMLNRRFIGFEINPEYCKIAEKRLKGIPIRLDNLLFNEANRTRKEEETKKEGT